MPPKDKSLDFADALSSALRTSPFTLTQLQAELARRDHRVSVATLSYWQTGRSLPARAGSLATVGAIEEILGLPSNSLLSVLAEAESPIWSPTSVIPDAQRPDDVLEEMGLSFNTPIRHLVLHDMVHTGAPDGHDRQVVRQLIRSEIDGLQRFPAVFYGTDNDAEVPVISAGHGVRVGQVVPMHSIAAIVVELLLPQTLDQNDMQWLEYEVSWVSDGSLVNSHGRSLARGATYLTMGAVFRGEELPVAARYCHTGAKDGVTSQLADWTPPPRQVQFSLRNAPPGSFDLEWNLPGAETTWG